MKGHFKAVFVDVSRNPWVFLCWFMTVNETWIHCYALCVRSSLSSGQWIVKMHQRRQKLFLFFFCRLPRNHSDWPYGERYNNNRMLLRNTIWSYERRSQTEIAKTGVEKVQHIFLQINHHYDTIAQIMVPNYSSSTLFFRPGPMWLIPVSKPKRWLCGKFLSNENVTDAINSYFAAFKKNYYANKMKKVGLMETILRNNINFSPKKFLSSFFFHAYQMTLVSKTVR